MTDTVNVPRADLEKIDSFLRMVIGLPYAHGIRSSIRAMLAAAPKVEQEAVAWLIEHPLRDRRVIDARAYDPTTDSFWLNSEFKAEHSVRPLYRHPAPASDELLEASVNLQSARELHRKSPTYKNAMVVREASAALDAAIAKHKGPQS